MSTILHVLAPGRAGGLERVVAMLAGAQRADQLDARVVAVLDPAERGEHPFLAELAATAVPYVVLRVGARDYVGEARGVLRVLRGLPDAVVHTHGYRADVVGGWAARRAGVPAVATVHGYTGGGWRNRLNERVQALALRRADAVVAVSRPLVERLRRAGVRAAAIHLVRNGLAPVDAPLARAEARAALGIPADALVAGWVGRLSPEKGADVAIEALASAPSAWRLAVIGDGPQGAPLRERAAALGVAERVRWLGLVPAAARYLAAFDAFVLSSRTEGTPIALLEAMAMSIPVVATRVGGVPDVMEASEGLLVDSEHPRAIGDALAAIARDEPAARVRAQAAARRVALHHSLASWVEAHARIYAAARSRRAARPGVDATDSFLPVEAA